jgi:membrane associated rhomboid family serine protease
VLILPLHKRLTAATFPVVTLLLIAVNVFVYLFLQSGDNDALDEALSYYRSSGLVQHELPAYAAHLKASGEVELAEALKQMEEPERSWLAFMAVQNDEAFLQALREDQIITPDQPGYADWKPARTRLDTMWSQRFTDRWLLSYERFDPLRLVSSMFLHGDGAHLIGNMVFLALLGLLVEGALGGWLFLVLYLLAGMGGGALSFLRHAGEPGGMLGASGAIAGLMGAYCVVWGLRKVRFFYWLFVYFDYVKAPALILLPLWLGWELYSMSADPEAGVAFDAHAGGIMSGALLAFVVRKLGWENRAFMDEDEARDRDQLDFDAAMAHLGRLEFNKARGLLIHLAERHPQSLEILVPLYRAWRNEPSTPGFHAAAHRVLMHPATQPESVSEIRKIFADYLQATNNKPRLSAVELLTLARRWTMVGALEESERLLGVLATRARDTAGLADALFELALAYRNRRNDAAGRRVLEQIVSAYAQSPQAQKAKFLLDQAG